MRTLPALRAYLPAEALLPPIFKFKLLNTPEYAAAHCSREHFASSETYCPTQRTMTLWNGQLDRPGRRDH